MTDGELSLEPLHLRHAADWIYQTRGGDVAQMTHLPRLDRESDAREWIAERWVATHARLSPDAAQRFTFAIVDRQAGFVGSLSLHRKHQRAFFSFWVGTDHQGRGFGTRAARLAFELSQTRLGIRELFTATFHHNHRSQRVLLRAGWNRLPFAGEPPFDVLDFFHRPEDSLAPPANADHHRSLDALLRDIGSNFRLAALAERA